MANKEEAPVDKRDEQESDDSEIQYIKISDAATTTITATGRINFGVTNVQNRMSIFVDDDGNKCVKISNCKFFDDDYEQIYSFLTKKRCDNMYLYKCTITENVRPLVKLLEEKTITTLSIVESDFYATNCIDNFAQLLNSDNKIENLELIIEGKKNIILNYIFNIIAENTTITNVNLRIDEKFARESPFIDCSSIKNMFENNKTLKKFKIKTRINCFSYTCDNILSAILKYLRHNKSITEMIIKTQYPFAITDYYVRIDSNLLLETLKENTCLQKLKLNIIPIKISKVINEIIEGLQENYTLKEIIIIFNTSPTTWSRSNAKYREKLKIIEEMTERNRISLIKSAAKR